MAPENNDSIVGSTITPTTTVSPKLVTHSLDTDKLNIGGIEVDGISHTTDIPSEDQTRKLASVYAVESSLYDTEREMEDIKNDLDSIYFSPVLSDPILDPFFVDAKWEIDGFVRELSGVTFTRKSQSTGYVKILSDAFVNPGKYFLYIQIASLPSGKIVIRNQSDVVLKEILSTGIYGIEVIIEQPTVDFIEFIATDITVNQTVQIDAIYAHYVKTSFSRYLDYLVGMMLSGGSGFASELYVQTVINQTLATSQAYTNTVVENISSDIELHVLSNNNPHHVTAAQTGAALVDHTHTPASIGAATEVHTHTSSEVSGISLPGHTHTPNECGAAPVVHTHDLTELGVAPVVHTHVPEECGAAPEDHDHFLADITDVDTIYTQISDLETLIQTSTTSTTLEAHLNNYNNPHHVTVEQLELELVVNAPMATVQETIDGILENRYVNPKGDRAALDALLGGQVLDPTKLIPMPIQKLVWDNQDISYTIPIFKDRLYKLAIKCNNNESLKSMNITLDTAPIQSIRNNICMSKKQTLLSGEIIQYMGWDYNLNDTFLLMLPTAGINKAEGELTLNTGALTLTGIMHGYVIDPATGLEVLDNSFPYIVASGFKPNLLPPTFNNLIIHSGATPVSMEIVVYELIQPTQEPTMVIDATPIGTIVQRYGEQVVPGWVSIDGSELSRITHPELWQYAQSSGYLVDEYDWQVEVTTNGFSYNFSTGDSATTFRIPKFEEPTTPMKSYMKAKFAQLQDSDEILYRFIWEN